MMVLRQTVLPEPVAPATSMCGILVRSATHGMPATSLPSEIARFDLADLNSFEERMSRRLTVAMV